MDSGHPASHNDYPNSKYITILKQESLGIRNKIIRVESHFLCDRFQLPTNWGEDTVLIPVPVDTIETAGSKNPNPNPSNFQRSSPLGYFIRLPVQEEGEACFPSRAALA
jgi:hypothetical protein